MSTSWDPWLWNSLATIGNEVSWYVLVFQCGLHSCLAAYVEPCQCESNGWTQDDFFMVKLFLFRLWVGSAAAVAIIHNEKIAFASARLGKCLLALWIMNHAWFCLMDPCASASGTNGLLTPCPIQWRIRRSVVRDLDFCFVDKRLNLDLKRS